jgi:3-hydroxy-9,10-secoandrosta-1,3,5(10)-triene-9,17-dione monooxygenase reductase component
VTTPPAVTTSPAAIGLGHALTQSGVDGPALRAFMRNWPGGVAIVTARRGRQPTGCTVTAFISVSLNPPLVLVSLAEQSRTLSAITAQGAFGVNVIPWDQRHLAERFAATSPDKFIGVNYRWRGGVPVLLGAMAAMVCSVDQVLAASDHILIFGRPTWCDHDGGTDPVILFGGAYSPLGAQ